MRSTKHSRRGQRGATMLEFTLSFMVIVFLVFSIFEMIMIMYTYSTLTDAAKEGVRYAIVHGSNNATPSGPGNVTAVQTVVRNVAGISLHDVSGTNLTVAVAYPDGSNASPNRVTVTVTYPYLPYINLPWTMPTISATAAGTIAN